MEAYKVDPRADYDSTAVYDPVGEALLEDAPTDPAIAEQLMSYLADRIDNHQPLSPPLTKYLANALRAPSQIEKLKPSVKDYGRALTKALFLSFSNRRPAENYKRLALACRLKIDEGLALNEAAAQVADKHKVSPSSVVRYYKKQEAEKEAKFKDFREFLLRERNR